jgi:hypothetical protein
VKAGRIRSPRVVLAAAGGLLALAVLGLTVGRLAAHGSGPAPATATAIGTASTAAAPQGRTSSPPAPPPEPPPPAAALGDLRWVDFHRVRVPVSASAGPRDYPLAGAPGGFARSPAGAVMAAVHIALRVDDRFGPAVFAPTVRQRVTGPDAAAALAAVQQDRAQAGVPEGEAAGPVYVSLDGFRLDGYSPAAAVVHLLAQGPADSYTGAGYADYRVELRWASGDWAGGDWSMLAPPGGRWEALVTIATSPAATPGSAGERRCHASGGT